MLCMPFLPRERRVEKHLTSINSSNEKEQTDLRINHTKYIQTRWPLSIIVGKTIYCNYFSEVSVTPQSAKYSFFGINMNLELFIFFQTADMLHKQKVYMVFLK